MRLLYLLFTLFLLSGCSHRYQPNPSQNTTHKSYDTSIKTALYHAYQRWKKTPYRYGGESLHGVDCSSLVQHIYRDYFGVNLPRTTKEQAKSGYWIARRDVREGDLVLFKTGYNSRHSGIYLEKGNFINSSSKYGVTISNLNNPYWRSKYWQSRRVLP